MLTFRRALIVAVSLLTLFLLLRSSHTSPPAQVIQSPKSVQSEETTAEQESDSKVPAKESAILDSEKPATLPTPKKQKPQIALEDLHAKPLREQLEYQFPYDPQAKFPAYIWQTWKYTPASGEFDDIFREPEASWTILHPTFVHEVITDSVAVHLIRHLYASVPEVLEAYNALPLPVLKADFFRYLILLARGGIYSDIDTAALKPATEWVPADVPRSSYGLVVGIEADPDREDWADWYSRRIQFCQWTIQAKPGHPVLREVVANITEETLRRKNEGHLIKDVNGIVEFTGPALWTDTVFNFFNDPEYFDMSTSKGNITWEQFTGIAAAKKVGDVIVLPITSFSPGVRQMGAGDDDDPMAFVKHNFEGTWKPESERHIGE
ncbi:glycosyltransferase family 32 protein [Aplosporella prunicola CBS 121167]|uniref:Glycosyltransferase family 32 protein n=1 Tax=Aplosporella prunicola CBS 121167 TaxID=1176127 RepID=A0A6A6B8D9_9PEZI|nr:glycosyltransferase family 32 protein [Aplosporella prunicola CBS 121167]KAF2139051.1 glycosyltransferase family 32 protein [Aplosporella prunicola CBS 121167]